LNFRRGGENGQRKRLTKPDGFPLGNQRPKGDEGNKRGTLAPGDEKREKGMKDEA